MESLIEGIFRNLERKTKEQLKIDINSWALAKNPRRLKLAKDLIDVHPNALEMQRLYLDYLNGK